MINSSDSEILIEGNDDISCNNSQPFGNMLNLESNIEFCQGKFSVIQFQSDSENIITFQIYNSFLPMSILHINEFDKNPILCEITIELSYNWKEYPHSFSITNPIFKTNFVGKNLIANRIRSFFSSNYHPSPFYLSQNYLLTNQIPIDHSGFVYLSKLGYQKDEVIKALSMMNNDIKQSLEFLETGINTNELKILSVDYNKFPLFYLILEITEVFFELSDHCCICGCPLGITGVRLMVCSSKICNFSFTEIGVSVNIIGEIRRDPDANDLLISLASTTYQTKFFNPKPANFSEKDFELFFKKLPKMQDIANNCQTDRDLRAYLQDDKMFEILKFLILANKAHIITLNQPEMQIEECSKETKQFLLTIANPEFEKRFQIKKDKYGNAFLWHGSNAGRWYSILHHGLKDLGRTVDRLHGGPVYGDGIYQSNSAYTSIQYCSPMQNQYENSQLPKSLNVIAMVENAKTPGFHKAVRNEYIQPDEEACIIRVLMVLLKNFAWDLVKNPPTHIPTLNDMLKMMSKNK